MTERQKKRTDENEKEKDDGMKKTKQREKNELGRE